jgi:predicted flap endonuclease-1-like 5' DNA nuclease
MYLLSQLWLYLLLACLAGLALGLLLNRICQQRRYTARLDALQARHHDDRTRSDAVLAGLRNEHALTLEAAGADRAALQSRLDALDAERRVTGERALSLSANVDAHRAAGQELDAEVESLQGRIVALQGELEQEQRVRGTERSTLESQIDALRQDHQSLQTAYESRIMLLNTETSRAVHLTDQLADLQSRHTALEATHRTALAHQADVAKEAYAALVLTQGERDAATAALEQQRTDLVAQRDRQIGELQAALGDQETAWRQSERQIQELRDAQAAGQSAALLREQAIQQELAMSQSRSQELEAELRALRLTLAENDEQLATLGARLQAEREQQQQAQARIAELALQVPPPASAPAAAVVVRPAVSAAATITSAELERLVLAAGAGQQPAPVEIDHQPPDDLKVIDGIGPVNERWLHTHGVRYFWQIASWSPAELAWVALHLPNFGSRVYRENWIAQAARLAARQSSRG